MTDLEALAAYNQRQDPESFRHLVVTYQGMVYSACKRMLDSKADIEETVQDVFVSLAKNAGKIRSNPASWLYACAVSTARDRRKSDIARKQREQKWTELQKIGSGDDFRALESVIDDCINRLPDAERELILQHYTLGRTQVDLAEEEGISQPAINKRLNKAVDQLREKLRAAGIATSAILLGSFFVSSSAEAAVSEALTSSLCKVGLVGVGKGAASAVTLGKIAAGIAIITAVGIAATAAYSALNKQEAQGNAMTSSTQPTHPNPSAFTITDVPNERMTIRKTGYGVGMLWCSHLRLGRREIVDWFAGSSLAAKDCRTITESTVTRRVRIQGKDCFEVAIRERKHKHASWSDNRREYFWLDQAGTHWVRPKNTEDPLPAFTDATAWESQDEDEGVQPHTISTDGPPEDSRVTVVDLMLNGKTTRCLRHTFFEVEPGWDPTGGDAFYRADGTCIFYRRLLGEGSKRYAGLKGNDEFTWNGKAYRVWEQEVLTREFDKEIQMPDYSKLELQGFGQKRDSISAVIQAALRMYDRETDYEELYMMSTNAFAPGIELREPCRSWWHVDGSMGALAMPELERFAGFRLHSIKPGIPEKPEPAFRKEFAALMRSEMESGRIVMTYGGWAQPGIWAFAGIVKEAKDDGTITGATFMSLDGTPWKWPYPAHGLELTEPEADRAELHREMLNLAVQRIRGVGRFMPREKGKQVYGLAAMDAWIDVMKKDKGFCAECYARAPKRSWGDATDNAIRMHTASQLVARQLRKIAPGFPLRARPYLEEAAASYGRIVGLLAPVLKNGATPYQSFIGDLSRQKVHSETTLTQVKQELASAAESIEQALHPNQGRANRMGNRTVIENVREVRVNGYEIRELECIAVAMDAVGWDLSYEDILGLSGMAFRIHFLPREGVCPSTVSPRYGFKGEEALVNAGVGVKMKDTGDLDQAAYEKLITEKIDAGIPVPAKGPWWYGVIVGYEKGDEFKVVVREAEKDKYSESTGKASIVYLLSKPEIKNTAVLQSLKTAVTLAETKSFDEYNSGYQAFSDWAAMMKLSDHKLAPQIEAHRGDGGLKNCNAWQYPTLIASREAASAYLRKVAVMFDAEQGKAIVEVADLYTEIVAALRAGMIEEWKPESRAKQGDALEAALVIERQAIEALKKVLD